MEVIRIQTTENGQQAVFAKDLHRFFEIKTDFSHWIKRMLKYGFVENTDYFPVLNENGLIPEMKENVCPSKMTCKRQRGGHNVKEYILTLDCAKAISMVQRSPKGKEIRTYFIEAEKQFRIIATPQQVRELHSRVTELENRQIDYTEDWTVDRYLRTCNLLSGITSTHRQQLGKLCAKMYRQDYGTPPKKVPHPSYTGGQNVYPYPLINTVFKEWKKKP
ncbi:MULTISPECIES: antA/AntB antirepressor family protein [unclassified Chryseobacterium]|uniref:antA/AntB antirepressor family protein n=1 Tax=unclassified Chryseobacterium TaxID=2593645 RepID=UPI000D378E1E|nr:MULTISPECIES: antA/AntB antirepressor family protein [unclassified Chryseobacterium]PTT77195.1 hypothetical protein DBR25_03825 [Chryseobacterium sp. HMWF001]PVV54802.1 hypothetical protein DD829_16410 [Chryseobacterium sp. HMWF035]